jgi:hypothetical protein
MKAGQVGSAAEPDRRLSPTAQRKSVGAGSTAPDAEGDLIVSARLP